MRQIDLTATGGEFVLVSPLHLVELRSQAVAGPRRQKCSAIVASLAAADHDLPAFEVHVLHPYREAFEQAEAATVEDLIDAPERGFELVEEGEDVAAREHHQEVVGARSTLKPFQGGHFTVDGPISVDSIDDCSGGGFPEFNIDRWHIRDDGNLYTLEDTEEKGEFGGLFGRSPYKTRVVMLDLASAKKTSLTVLFPPYRPSGEDGIKRVAKAIRKMSDHRELFNDALKREFETTLEALKKGEEPAASNDADGDDDLEIEL